MAAIKLDEDTVGIWTIQLTEDSDFFGALRLGLRGHVLDCRFRYYVDEKIFDSKDPKHRCIVELLTSNREAAIETVRGMVGRLELGGAIGPKHEILMDEGGMEKFAERLTALPSIHAQPMEEDV